MPPVKKFVRKKVEITDDILCDLCGKSCKDYLGEDVPIFNYARVEPEFGYGSKLDGKRIRKKFLCEDCFIKLFRKF